MKSRLNLLVLFAILCTSLPSHSTFAQEAENEQNEEITIEVPAEAVAASEELVASNQIAATANEEKQPSCIKSGVAISPKMNKEQRKELFIRGRITDCEGQIWNIKIIPGSDISKQMTIKSWRFASDKTKELFKIETYSKAVSDAKSSSRASFDFAKSSSKLLKKGIWDYIIVDGIYNSLLVDTKNTWAQAGYTVVNLRGSFGWIFGAIYAGLLKPVVLTAVNVLKAGYHVTAGTIVLVGGIAGTTGGIVATVSSPVVVPAVEVLTRPLLAIGSVLTSGSVIPGAIYVWNGAAWVTSQLSHVPDSEVFIAGVGFVSLENPKQEERRKVELTLADFKVVVESSVRVSAMNEKQEELLAKQDELRKKINDLQKQSNELEDEKIDLRRIHDSHPVAVALNNLYSREQGADTSLSQEVQKMALDDAKLKEIVLSYAAELNIKLNEKEIEATIKDIKLKMKTSTPKE